MSAQLYEEVEGEPFEFDKPERSIRSIRHHYNCVKLGVIATRGKARHKYYVDKIRKIEEVLQWLTKEYPELMV